MKPISLFVKYHKNVIVISAVSAFVIGVSLFQSEVFMGRFRLDRANYVQTEQQKVTSATQKENADEERINTTAAPPLEAEDEGEPGYVPGELFVKFRKPSARRSTRNSVDTTSTASVKSRISRTAQIAEIEKAVTNLPTDLGKTLRANAQKKLQRSQEGSAQKRSTRTPGYTSQDNPKAEVAIDEELINRIQERFEEMERLYHIELQPTKSVGGVEIIDEEQAIADLSKLPEVEWVERVPTIELSRFVPNDPQYDGVFDQWSFDDHGIGMEHAWSISKGSPSVKVAVLDTGYDFTHPDKPTSIQPGYDFYYNDPNAQDYHGHGSHVIGVITANTNNGVGTAGIAPNTTILPVKIFSDSGRGSLAAVLNGLNYALTQGADVVSNSWGISTRLPEGTEPQSVKLVQETIRDLHDSGAYVVFSAGNSSRDIFYDSLSRMSEVTAVAATKEWSNQEVLDAGYSNFGHQIDILAPGTDIRSHWINGQYRAIRGTSMAAPHVSGVAALLIAEHGYTNNQVAHAIKASAENYPHEASFAPLQNDIGTLHAHNALEYPQNVPDVFLGLRSATNRENIMVDVNVKIDPGPNTTIANWSVDILTFTEGFHKNLATQATHPQVLQTNEYVTIPWNLAEETTRQNYILRLRATTSQGYTLEEFSTPFLLGQTSIIPDRILVDPESLGPVSGFYSKGETAHFGVSALGPFTLEWTGPGVSGWQTTGFEYGDFGPPSEVFDEVFDNLGTSNTKFQAKWNTDIIAEHGTHTLRVVDWSGGQTTLPVEIPSSFTEGWPFDYHPHHDDHAGIIFGYRAIHTTSYPAQIDDDDELELITLRSQRLPMELYAHEHTSELKQGNWPIVRDDVIADSAKPTIVDLDGNADGNTKQDILIQTRQNNSQGQGVFALHIYDADGNVTEKEFTAEPTSKRTGTPIIVEDIDKQNPGLEILIYGYGKLHLLNSQGNTYATGWPKTIVNKTNEDDSRRLALAQLDTDEDLEIVLLHHSGNWSTYGEIQMYNPDGSNVVDPISIPYEHQAHYIQVADTDGNGLDEVYVYGTETHPEDVHWQKRYIFKVDHTGAFSTTVESYNLGHIGFADITGDNKPELLYGDEFNIIAKNSNGPDWSASVNFSAIDPTHNSHVNSLAQFVVLADRIVGISTVHWAQDERRFFVLDFNGNAITTDPLHGTWAPQGVESMYSADIDADGTEELIIGARLKLHVPTRNRYYGVHQWLGVYDIAPYSTNELHDKVYWRTLNSNAQNTRRHGLLSEILENPNPDPDPDPEGDPPEVRTVRINIDETNPGNRPGSGSQPTTWEMQRSDIRSINIGFSEEVDVVASDIILRNLGVIADSQPDTIVQLRDSQITKNGRHISIHFDPFELPDGVYELEFRSSITNDEGIALEPYTFTGDSNNKFYKLEADYNGDEYVSIFDIQTISYWHGHSGDVPGYIDMDSDGDVDNDDMTEFQTQFGDGVSFPSP